MVKMAGADDPDAVLVVLSLEHLLAMKYGRVGIGWGGWGTASCRCMWGRKADEGVAGETYGLAFQFGAWTPSWRPL